MTKFVTVEKNGKQGKVAPSSVALTQAMKDVGGVVTEVKKASSSGAQVFYTGNVIRSAFEKQLAKVVNAKTSTVWEFIWGDALDSAPATGTVLDPVEAAALLRSAVAATEKSVTIEIAPDMLAELKGSGYRLCFAKKVGTEDYNVVWQSYVKFLSNNTFSWTPQYELFGSNVFTDNITVEVATNTVPIGLGETSVLDSAGLLGDAYSGGTATAITMNNEYGSIHPGVNQLCSSSLGTQVSSPIYVAKDPIVKGLTTLKPVEKVLVWFEQNIQTSTMFSDSRSKAIEVDLTSVNSVRRAYANQEWSTPAG